MPTGKRKTQGNKSPSSKSGLTPESKQTNFTGNNMAAKRPQVIRTLNNHIIKDKCPLTGVLEAQCHDKTNSIGLYHYEPLQCHREGLCEYRTHKDLFVDVVGSAFFQEFGTWLSIGKNNMEEFKGNFNWGRVTTTVKNALTKPISTLIDKHKNLIIEAMMKNLCETLRV